MKITIFVSSKQWLIDGENNTSARQATTFSKILKLALQSRLHMGTCVAMGLLCRKASKIMTHQELNLTPEELETYFRLEGEIEKYNEAIQVMFGLIDNDLYPKLSGRDIIAELMSRRRKKEIEFETLQAKS